MRLCAEVASAAHGRCSRMTGRLAGSVSAVSESAVLGPSITPHHTLSPHHSTLPPYYQVSLTLHPSLRRLVLRSSPPTVPARPRCVCCILAAVWLWFLCSGLRHFVCFWLFLFVRHALFLIAREPVICSGGAALVPQALYCRFLCDSIATRWAVLRGCSALGGLVPQLQSARLVRLSAHSVCREQSG